MSATEGHVALPNGIRLWVRRYDFTDPWADAPTALLLHGSAESGDAFRQWIPHLARHFRIICPDLRGMGRSTLIAAGEALAMDDLAGDVVLLMKTLGISRYAIVGEKVGALLALRIAARERGAVNALALACGMIAPRDVIGPWVPEWLALIERGGPRAWVEATQKGRMGDELPPRALAWWSEMMAGQDHHSVVAYLKMLSQFALSHDELRAVQAPTLFLMPAGKPAAGEAFQQRRDPAELLEWQRLVPRYEIGPIDSNSYHLAATRPDACAIAARDFLLSKEQTPCPQ